LADPVKTYPTGFFVGTIFENFPYLLPNLICAAVVLCGLVIGILFLEETHEKKKHRRDIGLELGRWLIRQVKRAKPDNFTYTKLGDAVFEEVGLLVEDELPPGYEVADGSPTSTASEIIVPPHQLLDADLELPQSQHSVQKAFTKQVMLNIVSYGILA